ncbi:hypothetical protein BH18ACT3_BH18ACT3_27710 [soil metagenome]
MTNLHEHRPLRRRGLRVSVVAAVLAIGLVACGDDDDTASSSTSESSVAAEFNDADVEFARGMIPHHRQAVEMAAIALDPSVEAGADVQDLATRIEEAQDPEIELMTGFLAAWGQDASGETAGSQGMDEMDGMMTDEEMQSLADLRGNEFDRTWMEMMTEHHEGAIAMAEIEISDGDNPDAMALAEQITDAQQAEIDEMRTLLEG